jgi:hypothetical protein
MLSGMFAARSCTALDRTQPLTHQFKRRDFEMTRSLKSRLLPLLLTAALCGASVGPPRWVQGDFVVGERRRASQDWRGRDWG